MLGIISDVHGNYPALCAVLHELEKLGCDKIISLGDVTGYYCMVNECIEEFRKRKIINLLGNHDWYIINRSRCERSYTVNLCLDYQRKILKEQNFEWLKKSLTHMELADIKMVHGGWNNYIDEYLTDFSFLDIKSTFSFYISGHTHKQNLIRGKYAVYLNPGSVGQPRDYEPTAAYAILNEQKQIVLYRTEYDIDWIVSEMRRAGFEERISSCLYYGMKIGEDEE